MHVWLSIDYLLLCAFPAPLWLHFGSWLAILTAISCLWSTPSWKIHFMTAHTLVNRGSVVAGMLACRSCGYVFNLRSGHNYSPCYNQANKVIWTKVRRGIFLFLIGTVICFHSLSQDRSNLKVAPKYFLGNKGCQHVFTISPVECRLICKYYGMWGQIIYTQ